MLEAAVAAAGWRRAIAAACAGRFQRHLEFPLLAEIVAQSTGDVLARVAILESHQAERERRVDALSRIWAAECGLNQHVRHLERAELLAPYLEDDRISDVGGDGAGVDRRILNGRRQVRRGSRH